MLRAARAVSIAAARAVARWVLPFALGFGVTVAVVRPAAGVACVAVARVESAAS